MRWLAAALAGALAVQAAQSAVQQQVMPGNFIVQYHEDHDPVAVLDDIKRKHGVEVRQELHFKLFKGDHVVFPDAHTADPAVADIRAMDGVKRIWPSRYYEGPQLSVASMGNGHEGHGVVERGVDVDLDTFSPHVMTQVNLLRDAGYVGKGFKMAVVDSGIDYMHPALGGGFGPGYLVSFGRDLVGDDYNYTNTPVPDADPMDSCSGHGTHVAGIMAAQPDKNPYGIIGAATGISLGAYRVYGCQGPGTSDAVLIAAFNQAFEDGADLIHCSIGGVSGWPEELWAATVSTIVAKGVPCTLSTGNAGLKGLFQTTNGAGAQGAAAVGSVDNVLAVSLQVDATYTVNGGEAVSFGFTPGLPNNWTAQTLPLWTPVTNVSDMTNQQVGCDPYPDTTPNLSGYIVVMPRGPYRGACGPVTKAANAARWGAKHILEYNYVPGTRHFMDVTAAGTSIGLVTPDQGAEWVKLLLSGAKVQVHMVDTAKAPVVLATVNNTQSGGYMSTFTSWGPTLELGIKPQFAAPGRDILSTYPRALGSYVVDWGTSMAAPLVAAMYVLLMESTGVRDASMLGRLLSATAKQLDFNDGLQTRVGMLAPVAQQGAGMTQVFDASRTRTVFDVESLGFNDTEHFVADRNFTIINLSNDTLRYSLDHRAAATAYTFDDDKSLWPSASSDDTPWPNIIPNELVSGNATLEFFLPDSTDSTESPASFSIPAGKPCVVSVRVTKPTGLDDGRMPVWSGYIGLKGSDGSKLSLPYQGVTGRLRDRHVLDSSGTGVAGYNDGEMLLGPRTFLLPPAGKANLTRYSLLNDTDRPKVMFNLALGSALVRLDVVPVDVKPGSLNVTTILGTDTAGPLPDSPAEYNGPGPSDSTWDGRLQDGTYAPEGVYKISIKALHVFGDRERREDYDVVESVEFAIRYAYDL